MYGTSKVRNNAPSFLQSLRRAGQLLYKSNSTDYQYEQLKIAKKLYAKYGLEIIGGGACPEQYDVKQEDICIAYIRLRHGGLTVQLDSETIDVEQYLNDFSLIGDGEFHKSERLSYLAKILRIILKHYDL